MGQKKKQINVYSDKDLYEEIERRADEADMSMSGYMNMLAERHVQGELLTEASRELEAEERIEELVANATDDIEQSTDQALDEMRSHLDLMQLVLLRTGMYSAGTWKLIGNDYGDLQAKQAMQKASQRFDEEAREMGINLNAIGSDKPLRQDSGSSTSAASTSGSAATDSRNDSTATGDDSDDDDGWSY